LIFFNTLSARSNFKSYKNSGAGTIFGRGGARPRAPKSGTQNIGLRWNWSVFLSRKEAYSKKKVFAGLGAFSVPKRGVLQKKVFAGFGRFLSQKWLRIQVSGSKSRPGGAKIPPGEQPPPCLPTSRAHV